MADASTDAVQPAGAAPVGDGGPLVGPYVRCRRTVDIDDVDPAADVGEHGDIYNGYVTVNKGSNGELHGHLLNERAIPAGVLPYVHPCRVSEGRVNQSFSGPSVIVARRNTRHNRSYTVTIRKRHQRQALAARICERHAVTGRQHQPDGHHQPGGHQSDPTNAAPINFTVVFSEPVTGFTGADVTLSGTAGATDATVTGSGTTYNVAVSGMPSDGTVIASIPAGGASDAAGNTNLGSVSLDNTVTFDNTRPTVTINQAATQSDPTNAAPINFTVVFSEPVTGFTGADVTLSGTAGATDATVTGSGTTYNVAVSGMPSDGTVIASIPAGGASDAAGNTNLGSVSLDNTVTFDNTRPTVTINQAATQSDPTNAAPINFTVVFSEPVTGFTGAGCDPVRHGRRHGCDRHWQWHNLQRGRQRHALRRHRHRQHSSWRGQ